MKKTLLALFLAVVMLLPMTAPIFAEGISFAQSAMTAAPAAPFSANGLVGPAADTGANITDPTISEAGSQPVLPVNGLSGENLPELAIPTVDTVPVSSIPFSETAAQFDSEDLVTFIVTMNKAALLDKFSVDEIAEQGMAVSLHEAEQLNSLSQLQTAIVGEVGSEDGFELGYKYTVASTAVAVKTAYGNKAALESLPGVSAVYLAPTFKIPTYVQSDSLKAMTNNASTMIGADLINQSGYTGKGMRIAILDTGIVVDHPSFQPLSDDKLTASSLTVEEIESVWDTLNAKTLGTNQASATYQNTKIPFAFNYSTGTVDVSHSTAESDHGTHVAGIAAGNLTEQAVGVAPDAQLIVMQVFNPSGGASWDTIMAALEDCVRLNVDACNLSLGSAAGFTDYEPIMNEIMNKFKETDIEVLIASGNDTDSAYMNATGTNMSLSSNPDTGVAGAPSTYSSALAVASADNDGEILLYFTVAGLKIGYRDTATTDYTKFISNFSEKTLEFVMVPGYGEASDYEGLDVAGKVAVVTRGSTSFSEKQAAAQAAGAVACVVYNNTTGVINMQITDGQGNIPAISITQSAGAYMAAQYAAGVNTMTVCKIDEPALIKSERILSDFSSWGVTPDLKLKPEVTGVGGNIYSAVDPDISQDWYASMSGTSMATPQVTGAMAVLMQYLRAEYPIYTDAKLRTVAANIMMSTANPLEIAEGLEYSPRGQGAGLIDLVKATTTKGYLSTTTASEGRPKVEFGDDDAKKGVYNFTFEINNISEDVLTYAFDSSVLTATYAGGLMSNLPYKLGADVAVTVPGTLDGMCYDFNADGEITTADASVLLCHVLGVQSIPETDPHSAYLDVNGDGSINVDDVRVITDYCAEKSVMTNMLATYSLDRMFEVSEIAVPAGETVTVHVTITLTAEDKLYMNQFENGIYVEGFMYANAMDADNVDLTLPFVGFYGDWSAAPVFDNEDPSLATQYPRYIFNRYSMLGSNPYLPNGKAGDEYNVTSIINPLNEIDMGMLRNAKKLVFTAVDLDTNEEYFYIDGQWITKSYYIYDYGMIYPFWVTRDAGELWDGYTDKNGSLIADDSRVRYTCEAWLDDGDDIMDDAWSFDVTVDNSYPEIVNADTLQAVKGGTDAAPRIMLPLEIMENQHIAAVLFVNENDEIMGRYEADNIPGELYTGAFDITEYGTDFLIIVADYACNETVLPVSLDLGELGAIRPAVKDLDNNCFYACEVADTNAVATGWIKADKYDLSGLSNENTNTKPLYYSAEFVNGYVIAQRIDGDIVLLTPYSMYWKSTVLVESNGMPGVDAGTVMLYDMALDMVGGPHADENFTATEDRLLAVGWKYEDTDGDGEVDGYNAMFEIMFNENGDVELSEIAPITGDSFEYFGSTMLTLACSTDGIIYGMDTMGCMYTITIQETLDDSGNRIDISVVADLNFYEYEGDYYPAQTDFAAFIGSPNVIQAMTYDHNTGYLYWAGHTSSIVGGVENTVSYIMIVIPENGICYIVGDDETYANWFNSGCTSLFIPHDYVSDLF